MQTAEYFAKSGTSWNVFKTVLPLLLFLPSYSVQLQHYEDCFVVSLVHQTLTWTTESLTCASDFLHVYIHTGDLGLQFTRRTFVESAQNLTPEKSQGGRKAHHITVSHPYDDHARSCITLALAFESECSCSAPLTLRS